MRLEEGDLTLRSWNERDLDALRSAARDSYIALIETLPRPWDDSEGRAWLRRKRDDGRVELAIEVDGGAVGGVGYGIRFAGTADLGYWLLPAYRGRGLATRAVLLLAGHAFDDGGIHRLQAVAETWNDASISVLERAGFAREGLLRAYASYPGRERGDVYLYARLATNPR